MEQVRRGMNLLPQVRRVRRDGWTADRQRIFFEHLCATCNVRFAAARTGLSARSGYLKRESDPVFRERWRQALEEGYARLETMLVARAGGTADAAALEREAEAAGDAGAHRELTETLDTQLAMQLLAHHRRVVHGGTRRGGYAPTKVTPDQLADTILRQLAALNKRRGGKG